MSVSDKQGASSAHYVVWGGDSKCVKLLVSRGGRAVLTQRDRWGRTPLLVAAAKVCQCIVTYMCSIINIVKLFLEGTLL